jgi:hypothetical protein
MPINLYEIVRSVVHEFGFLLVSFNLFSMDGHTLQFYKMKIYLRVSSIVPLLVSCQWACPAAVSCWQQFPVWQTVEVTCLSTRILPLQSWGNYTNMIILTLSVCLRLTLVISSRIFSQAGMLVNFLNLLFT